MPIGSVLVDRARALESRPMPQKIEGSTQFVEVKGNWFKARLMLGPAPEQQDPAGSRRHSVARPGMLYAKKDLKGSPVLLTSADRIEIDSAQLGRGFWELTGDPEPLRKRRTVIGWQAQLSRVDDHPFSLRRGGSSGAGGGDAPLVGGGAKE